MGRGQACLIDKFEGGQCIGLDKVNHLAITGTQGRTKCIPAYVVLADAGCCLGAASVHAHGRLSSV